MSQNKLLSKIKIEANSNKPSLQVSVFDFNRENNQIVDKIKSIIPEFVNEEYPEFTSFLKKYFSYPLFDKSQNLEYVRDIDLTTGNFLAKLRKEFSVDSYEYEFLSDEQFLRHQKAILAKKGTIDSIRFLFYSLYGEEIEIDDLSDYIFRPSIAEWSQQRSINVAVRSNSITPESLVGNYIYIENEEGSIQAITVDDYEDITDKVQQQENSSFYRLFFRDDITIPVQLNNRVFNELENFTSFIIPSIQNIKILHPGQKFRIGQIIRLDNDTGSGAIAMVQAIDSNSGIKNVKILKFGDNYTSDFYLSVVPDGAYINTGEAIQTTGTADLNNYIIDKISSFSENGTITITNYMSSLEGAYFTMDYVSETQTSFQTTQVYYDEDFDSALILCKIGPIATHKGKYLSQIGMASGNSKIQDSNVYSDFSYLIKSKTDISQYKTLIEQTVHPAGFKLFGEKMTDQVIEMSQQISSSLEQAPFATGFLRSEIYSTSTVQINQMTVQHSLKQNTSMTTMRSTLIATLTVT